MTAKAEVFVHEMRKREDGIPVKLVYTSNVYDNWYLAKDALEELRTLYTQSSAMKESFTMKGDYKSFHIEVSTDNDPRITRYIDVFVVLNV